MSKKEYNYEYEEDRIVRATEANITLSGEIVPLSSSAKLEAKYKVLGNRITAKIDIAAVVAETVLAVIFAS